MVKRIYDRGMRKINITLLSIVALLSLVSSLMSRGDSLFYRFLKPIPLFLMMILIVINNYYVNKEGRSGNRRFALLILVGLIFGAAGDILLMFPKRLFLVGLGAFLVGHLFYVAAFMQVRFNLRRSLPMIALMTIFAILMGSALYINLSDKMMFIAVVFYILVIVTMAIMAYNFDREAGYGGIPLFTMGALFFCFSDSSLAWGKFIGRFPLYDEIVMTTYYGAQMLIVVATLRLLAIGKDGRE